MSDISTASIRFSAWRISNAEGQLLHVLSVGGDTGRIADDAQLIASGIETPDILRWIVMADVLLLVMDAGNGLNVPVSRLIPAIGILGAARVLVAMTNLGQGPDGERLFLNHRNAVLELSDAWRLVGVEVLPFCSTVNGAAVPAWYAGRSLIECLHACQPLPLKEQALCAQACSTGGRTREIHCDVLSGVLSPGSLLRELPSGRQLLISSLFGDAGELDVARGGDRVGLRLAEDVDPVAGALLAAADVPSPQAADQFEAQLLWLDARALVPGRAYRLRLVGQEVDATVTRIKCRSDLSNGAHLAARILGQNGVATVNVSTKRAIFLEPFNESRILGSFSLFDDVSGEWTGIGTIDFALRRASNIHWQALELNKQARARLKDQVPCCVWLTGLSGSGKSTIASLLEARLHASGRHTYVLDGDNVRHGLNRDLGFTEADRVENIRRVGEVARLMVDAGLIVIVSFISPFASERQMARSLFDEGEFVEVFVDTPLAECERRDVKGLYAKARSGRLQNFTGIDSAYEAPVSPDVHVQAGVLSANACVDIICEWLG